MRRFNTNSVSSRCQLPAVQPTNPTRHLIGASMIRQIGPATNWLNSALAQHRRHAARSSQSSHHHGPIRSNASITGLVTRRQSNPTHPDPIHSPKCSVIAEACSNPHATDNAGQSRDRRWAANPSKTRSLQHNWPGTHNPRPSTKVAQTLTHPGAG